MNERLTCSRLRLPLRAPPNNSHEIKETWPHCTRTYVRTLVRLTCNLGVAPSYMLKHPRIIKCPLHAVIFAIFPVVAKNPSSIVALLLALFCQLGSSRALSALIPAGNSRLAQGHVSDFGAFELCYKGRETLRLQLPMLEALNRMQTKKIE